MSIGIGDRLPDGKLAEATEFDPVAGCPINPTDLNIANALEGKRVVIFGVPGAFTPTCSAKHLPSYAQLGDQLKAKGVNEIWCVAVNDAFVMAAWGRDQKASGKIRMLADGSAAWARGLGLDLDLSARGMGVRMRRFSMLVEDGVITQLNIEAPGKFEVSDAATLLRQLG